MAPQLQAPDSEGACIALLQLEGISARDVLAPPYPATRLVRVGGTRARILDEAQLQLDVAGAAGSSKSSCLAAWERAYAVLVAAEGATAGGAVITAVRLLGGPSWLPDGVDGAPRYVGTLLVNARATTPQPA